MIIPIHGLSSSSSVSSQQLPPVLATLGSTEVVLLELQGEIEVEGDKNGQTVGTLTMDEDGKNKPTLRIGHNLLEGKLVTLPKPLAVLQRNTPLSSSGVRGEDPDDHAPVPATPEYTVRAVVRKKLLFSKRPMPIVSSITSSGKPVSTVGNVNR